MLILASLLIIVFTAYHVVTGFVAYRSQGDLLVSMGLILLGSLNCVVGLGILLSGYRIGVVASGTGWASIVLGTLLNEIASQGFPNWDAQALRISTGVFTIGLMVVAEAP